MDQDFTLWSTLQVSFWGTIQMIKMVTPRFYYVFGKLPLTIPAHMLWTIYKCIKLFTWAGRKPHLKLAKLHEDTKAEAYSPRYVLLCYHLSQLAYFLAHADSQPLWVPWERNVDNLERSTPAVGNGQHCPQRGTTLVQWEHMHGP